MNDRNFIWNLVFLGKTIEEYANANPRLIIEWYFPDEELGALILVMGTQEAYALEKKYLMYHDIEEMDAFALRDKVLFMLDNMAKKV